MWSLPAPEQPATPEEQPEPDKTEPKPKSTKKSQKKEKDGSNIIPFPAKQKPAGGGDGGEAA
jgi:hypothetical protein